MNVLMPPGRSIVCRRSLLSGCFLATLFVWQLLSVMSCFAAGDDAPAESPALRVGTMAVDITPLKFPVIVSGMFEERQADRVVDRLFARAFVLDNGSTRITIVIVDSCMLPRELLDEVKTRAAEITGIPTEQMLISATHTHSAPSAMGCLGSRADPDYPSFLKPHLVRAIQLANEKLEPAQLGWANVRAPYHAYCRRYIRRPDRLLIDPFGQPTARANMHPGYLSPDAIGPSGPVDDELSLLAIQTPDGKPLGVLANYSMHYIGSPLLSSDYFGRFAEHLGKRIDGGDGATTCIVAMSQGTSGDIASMNYSAAPATREYDRYAEELAEIAHGAYRQVKYQRAVPIAMREATLTLKRRVPDAERLAWAKEIAAKVGDRRPKGWPEVYALEQLMLAAEPERELKLQAVRLGEVAITAIPNEVFALTGLKLKLQSPLPATFNIELANGAEGYIPPPEQHKLGGYTTWAARTAGLEVDAEPKIVDQLLHLLEQATGKPRRTVPAAGGAYAAAVLESKPRGYWRLGDLSGTLAADSSGNHRDAHYEDGFALYLPGPRGAGFAANGASHRAVHFAGGRLRADVADVGDTYSCECWFWNGLPSDARPVTGYLVSRGAAHDDQVRGNHLGIGGTQLAAGRLFFFNGHEHNQIIEGQTPIALRTWNHIALVREGRRVRVYLNGNATPEIDGEAANVPMTANIGWFFGGRSDNFANLEGKMSDAAVYDRALSPEEVRRHYEASGVSAAE